MLKLSMDQLRVGVPLPWDVHDGAGQLLLRRGYVIERDSQLESLVARGMYVAAEALKPAKPVTTAPAEQRFDPFWLWQDVTNKLARVLRAGLEEPEFPARVRKLAEAVQTLVERNPDAALAALVLLEKNPYAVVHSLHVAVVCEILGRPLKWDPQRRLSTLCAALTMNVAMVDLQTVVVSQRTPLTPEQDAAIKAHPAEGVARLKAAGVTDELWLKAVLEHHESPDGKGYPAGIRAMAEESLLIRTADVFAAKVAGRASRKPMALNDAAKMLFVHESARQNRIVGLLIKELGIYPPGTIVELANEETAVVVKRGASAKTPMVYSLINAKGFPMLDTVRRDTEREEFAISRVVPRDNFKIAIDVNKIWTPLSR